MPEELYISMVEDLRKAKEVMAEAVDLIAFAKDAEMPVAEQEAKLIEMKTDIGKLEKALGKRGYMV